MSIVTDNSAVIAQLQKENNELKAHCDAYRNQLTKLQCRLQERFEWVLGTITQDLQQEYENSITLLKQAPKQSLNEIKAQAIKDAVNKTNLICGDDAICYANDLIMLADELCKGGEE